MFAEQKEKQDQDLMTDSIQLVNATASSVSAAASASASSNTLNPHAAEFVPGSPTHNVADASPNSASAAEEMQV